MALITLNVRDDENASLRRALKVRAAERGVSLSDYVADALWEHLRTESAGPQASPPDGARRGSASQKASVA
jgi:plasmid stability protein